MEERGYSILGLWAKESFDEVSEAEASIRAAKDYNDNLSNKWEVCEP